MMKVDIVYTYKDQHNIIIVSNFNVSLFLSKYTKILKTSDFILNLINIILTCHVYSPR